jgi:pyridoxal 5'-phosphate synthase pdxT subunit
MVKPRVGVLALQGDVPEHLRAVEQAGAVAVPVRRRSTLDEVEALILPGGESTTVGKLLERYDLMEPIRERARAGMPILGTCAGLILLAREIEGSDQPRLGLLDVTVRRNAYGRQVESFETDVAVPALGPEPVRAVFIRAPMVTRTGPEVERLAEAEGAPILVRQGALIGAAFHPEMAGEDRLHRFLIQQIGAR